MGQGGKRDHVHLHHGPIGCEFALDKLAMPTETGVVDQNFNGQSQGFGGREYAICRGGIGQIFHDYIGFHPVSGLEFLFYGVQLVP